MNDDVKLRHTFVSMLFALVIGQLAIACYEVFEGFTFSISWLFSIKERFMHLFVALILITTSWVGWSETFKVKNYPSIDGFWSRGYFLLLIDVVILILYFSLVKVVDGPEKISAIPEASIIMSIFILYVLWDALFSTNTVEVRCIELLPAGICALFCFLVITLLAESNVLLSDFILIFILFSFRKIKNIQIKITAKEN